MVGNKVLEVLSPHPLELDCARFNSAYRLSNSTTGAQLRAETVLPTDQRRAQDHTSLLIERQSVPSRLHRFPEPEEKVKRAVQ